MPQSRITITFPPDLKDEVKLRGDNVSEVITEAMGRYFEAMRRERATLATQFNEAECGLILDSLNGVLHGEWSIPLLWSGVEDSVLLDHLDTKWSVDGPALVAKLRNLSYTGSAAIVDAAERYWRRVGAGETVEPGEMMQ